MINYSGEHQLAPAGCVISPVLVILRSLRHEDLLLLGIKQIRFLLILRSK